MKKITLFHNSRCSKSRAVLEILEHAKIPFEVVEYLKTPPSTQMLDGILKQLKFEPKDIVRTGEDEYDEIKKNPPATREQWLQVLVENPILIERPIVSDGKSAVLGRPPENVLQWLKDVN